ncbi:MAG: aromatic ring-hydroxylating dioxygenase subunit alpha [Blastocatellia bacterium]|nr:aromatic ring-hydroxylating dioxygenase subunit alpha [Blastocatellia bacterium]
MQRTTDSNLKITGQRAADDAAVSETPGGEMLRDFWYIALRSSEVKGNNLKTAMLLGVPLVVGRDLEGRPFAMRDSCPHRGIPLSFGHFDGRQIECCYHGWRFDSATGQCREIPSLAAASKLKVERIFADSFPCEEQDGYVWVYMPASNLRAREAPPAPRLPVFSPRYRLTHLSAELPCSVDHGVIGLMDPAHGPFVHRSWWWRSRRSIHEKEKVFEPIPGGFRIRAHAPSANSAPYKLLRVYGQPITSTIEFILPNMRLEEIHCGPYWFSSRAVVTPVKNDHCRIDFCAAWNIFPRMPFVVSVFRLFARKFLGQDQQTMIKQAVGLKHNPSLMLIDDADRPARWYFQLKAAYLDSLRTGEPMEHPIPDPVTLHWRS